MFFKYIQAVNYGLYYMMIQLVPMKEDYHQVQFHKMYGLMFVLLMMVEVVQVLVME